MKPKQLSGFWKRGSPWDFSIIRRFNGVAVDISEQSPRAMFRIESVDGPVILTVDSSTGLTIPTPANGTIQFNLDDAQTVLFPVGVKVYFDIELSDTLSGKVTWQSPTYYIVAEQEVTRNA